jgi:hypothetical protein
MPTKRVSLKGKGADLFFGGQEPVGDVPEAEPAPESGDEVNERTTPEGTLPRPALDSPDISVQVQASPADGQDSDGNGYPASTLASDHDELTEAIRRVVKRTGREVSFVRLSPEEKGRLADIVYTYKRQGVRTSENEINRIAINLLLEDYDAHGGASVLARVLTALQA